MSFTNNYLTMWNHYICFHPHNQVFVNITPRKPQSSKCTMALSWSLTLASLQLYFCWTSPLLSTVLITPFSVLFDVPNVGLGPLPFILYTSNIVNIASQRGLMIHLYADRVKDHDNADVRDACCHFHFCVLEIFAMFRVLCSST